MGEKKVPIRVNGEAVSEALIAREFQMLRERYARELSPQELEEQREQIESDARENAVEYVLLMQQARKQIAPPRAREVEVHLSAFKAQHGGEENFEKQFHLSPEDEEQIKADLADGIQLEKYFDELCKKAVRPTEDDLLAYYQEHPEQFFVPEQVDASHILQQPSESNPLEKVYAELLNLLERLKAGEDFDALAREHSHCQDGNHHLGYFTRGQMVQAFEEVAFSTPIGEWSDIFQTEFGYHILMVHDRKPEATLDFEEVRYDIEAMLFDERKNEVIGAMADQLRSQANIQNLEKTEVPA